MRSMGRWFGPVRSNAGFLVEALDHSAFVGGTLDTGLIAREGDALMPPAQPSEEALVDAAAALAMVGSVPGFRVNSAARHAGRFLLDGQPVTIDFAGAERSEPAEADSVLIAEGGQVWELARWRATSVTGGAAADGAILSPMPGRIISVDVAAGDAVTKGQKLVTLEAMKMEHSLVAPFEGTVEELAAVVGRQVSDGEILARIVSVLRS